MGYIEQNLLKDEKILYRTKKHLIIFLIPVILTGVTLFFYFNKNPYAVKLTVFPAIATVIVWINQALVYFTSEFAITNKRILMKEGFFFRHANDTRITTIANVSVNQSLLGQVFGFGTVVINTYGGGTDPFTEIDAPVAFQKCLQQQVDQAVK